MSKSAIAAVLATALGLSGTCVAADQPAPDWTKQGQPGAAAAAPTSPPPQARIAFASRGGIYNWNIPDDKTVFVEDLHHQWYRGDLMSNACIGLHFALRVGFTFEPNGDFDKFDSVLWEHQRCPLISLIMVDPPEHFKGKVGTPGAVPASYAGNAFDANKMADAKNGSTK